MSDLNEPTAGAESDYREPGEQAHRAESDYREPGEQAHSGGLISSASAPAPSQVSSAWSESTEASAAAATPAAAAPAVSATATVELDLVEARVIGALIEKSFLTPDVYPMTTNAMVSACNQKTNRDPVVAYTAVDVDGAFMQLRQRNLVRRVHSPGSRSTKHRQTLDEALALNDGQLALISVLLLRGPQTIGELRLRTERHDVGFDDLDAVESALVGLSSRQTPLVVQLARQPGHKEARWKHVLGDSASDSDSADGSIHVPDVGVADVGVETAATRRPLSPAPAREPLEPRVVKLESEVAALRRQLDALAAQLGETLE